MEGPRLDLVCVGEAILDMIPIDGFTYKAAFGGAPMNTAVAAARLGLRVGALTSVGSDAFGRFLLETLRERGVDVSRVKVAPYRTTLAVVVKLPGDEREFFFYRKPWSLSADTELVLDEGDVEYARSAKVVHVTGFILSQEPARSSVLQLLEEVAGRATVSFDPTHRPDVWGGEEEARGLYRRVVELADVVLLTLRECEVVFGAKTPEEAVRRAREAGVKVVGVKMGGRGGVLADEDRAVFMPAYRGVEIKDTVGAGDAWNAAVIYSMLRGFDLEWAINFAHAVAVIKCMHVGAIAGLPTPEEVGEFVRKHGRLPARELKA